MSLLRALGPLAVTLALFGATDVVAKTNQVNLTISNVNLSPDGSVNRS